MSHTTRNECCALLVKAKDFNGCVLRNHSKRSDFSEENREKSLCKSGAGCTKGGLRYIPDSDFFNGRKNAYKAIKLQISNS